MARKKHPIGIQAFAEIREDDYYYVDKYRSLNQPIHLIGVAFSKKARNVVGFAAARLDD